MPRIDRSVDDLSIEQLQRLKREIWGPETAARAAGPSIVAEGDSWFDFPLRLDVLDWLKRRHDGGFARNVIKLADAGDTLEDMAFGTSAKRNAAGRPPALEELLARVEALRPPVLLLSAGGNDVAGKEFESLLRHRRDPSGEPIRRDAASELIGRDMRAMLSWICEEVWERSAATHVIVHGYGNAIPDGRSAGIPILFRVGPWLRPALLSKGYVTIPEGRAIVTELIGQFNAMLARFDGEHERFHHVDVRDVIEDDDWTDELHLTGYGFGKVAQRLDAAIESVLERRPTA